MIVMSCDFFIYKEKMVVNFLTGLMRKLICCFSLELMHFFAIWVSELGVFASSLCFKDLKIWSFKDFNIDFNVSAFFNLFVVETGS